MASVAPPAGSTFGRVSRDIIGALWGADWRYKSLMAVLILILFTCIITPSEE